MNDLQYSSELYGLTTDLLRPKSILHQILTCTHPKQLEWVVKHLAMEAEYPSTRALRRWKNAIRAKQKELGVRVMIEENEGGTANGG